MSMYPACYFDPPDTFEDDEPENGEEYIDEGLELESRVQNHRFSVYDDDPDPDDPLNTLTTPSSTW